MYYYTIQQQRLKKCGLNMHKPRTHSFKKKNIFLIVNFPGLPSIMHQTSSSCPPYQTWPLHSCASLPPPCSAPDIKAHIHTDSQFLLQLADFGCLCSRTFSCLMSSFFTDLRWALRSMSGPLFLDPNRALIISSAETLTFLRVGFLNFPPRSCTFRFNSLIQRWRICDILLLKKGRKDSWNAEVWHAVRMTYIPVVLRHFGFTVVPLLVHLVNLCMHLLTEFLQSKLPQFQYKNQILLHMYMMYSLSYMLLFTCRPPRLKSVSCSGGSFSSR